MKTFAAFLLLAAAPVFGEADPPERSCGSLNGRAWKTTAKFDYLVGLRDALVRTGAYDTYFPEGLSYGDIASAIDAIYADPANVLIPIIDVLREAKLRFEGTAQPVIDYGLALKRKRAMACTEHQPKPAK